MNLIKNGPTVDSSRAASHRKDQLSITSLIVTAPRPAVNSDEFHIGLPVRARTCDSFNGKRGTIAKIVHGMRPAFYVRLNDPTFRELLYFAGNELEVAA